MGLQTKNLSVLDAVVNRRSVRRFLSTPVPKDIVAAILTAAARAPSGTNIQPWRTHIVEGRARDDLSRAVIGAAGQDQRCDEDEYMPAVLKEPHLSRRRKVGYDLYQLYGITQHDYPARKQAMLWNFDFFGAPVGLFFTVERYLLHGSWLDCGMFMQNVMLLAREFGLESCPQRAWCEYGAIVHEQLGIPDEHIIVSGMALGYEDADAVVNSLQSERVHLDEFATFHG